jgi:acyl homoserine lactone synthase
LVALVDLYHERLLRRLGVTTRRYGHPQNVGYDTSGRALTAVVGEIPMREQSGQDFQNLMRQAALVEFNDETLVLGRWAVPA